MSRKPDYDRGRDDGLRWAVTWLHNRAKEMVDWHATVVLNSAAFNLGVEIKRPKISPPPEQRAAITADAAKNGKEGE